MMSSVMGNIIKDKGSVLMVKAGGGVGELDGGGVESESEVDMAKKGESMM